MFYCFLPQGFDVTACHPEMSPRSKLFIYMCEGSYIVHISTTSHISACKYSHNYLLVPKISLWLFPSSYRCCLIWTLSWPVGFEHMGKMHLNSCLFFWGDFLEISEFGTFKYKNQKVDSLWNCLGVLLTSEPYWELSCLNGHYSSFLICSTFSVFFSDCDITLTLIISM